MKLNPLTEKISKRLSIHPSRQNTMAAMIFSVLCSNNVHHQSLVRYADSSNPKAALRKVERFEEYVKAVVETFGFKGKFDLSLDRSN